MSKSAAQTKLVADLVAISKVTSESHGFPCAVCDNKQCVTANGLKAHAYRTHGIKLKWLKGSFLLEAAASEMATTRIEQSAKLGNEEFANIKPASGDRHGTAVCCLGCGRTVNKNSILRHFEASNLHGGSQPAASDIRTWAAYADGLRKKHAGTRGISMFEGLWAAAKKEADGEGHELEPDGHHEAVPVLECEAHEIEPGDHYEAVPVMDAMPTDPPGVNAPPPVDVHQQIPPDNELVSLASPCCKVAISIHVAPAHLLMRFDMQGDGRFAFQLLI